MKIIEVFANRRSGHHFFMSWFVSNLSGFKDDKIKDLNKITWITDKICHYNDATYHAFFDEEKVKCEINEIIQQQPEYLIINYEESELLNRLNKEGTQIYNNNPQKVVFIRDFLNTMAYREIVDTSAYFRNIFSNCTNKAASDESASIDLFISLVNRVINFSASLDVAAAIGVAAKAATAQPVIKKSRRSKLFAPIKFLK